MLSSGRYHPDGKGRKGGGSEKRTLERHQRGEKRTGLCKSPGGIYLWPVRSAEEALQILWAAKVIHPELFADLDMVAEVRKFHKKFYKYDLTADEAGRRLHALQPDSQG